MIEAEWGPLFKGLGGKKLFREYSIDPEPDIAGISKGPFQKFFFEKFGIAEDSLTEGPSVSNVRFTLESGHSANIAEKGR